MALTLPNVTLEIDASTRPPFRATPSGFSAGELLVTQGCATFAIAHVAPPWANMGPPLRGFWLTISESQNTTNLLDFLQGRIGVAKTVDPVAHLG